MSELAKLAIELLCCRWQINFILQPSAFCLSHNFGTRP